MVTNLPHIGLGIVTADCAPILFCDPRHKIIGAAHAGWKGALTGVVGATIEAMVTLGATRDTICAAVGPCISQNKYEVGQEFFEKFTDDTSDHSRFFINGHAGKYHFDLPGFVITQLRQQDICAIDWVNKCTYTNDSEYFSYRCTTHRQESDYGRQLSVITNSVE